MGGVFLRLNSTTAPPQLNSQETSPKETQLSTGGLLSKDRGGEGCWSSIRAGAGPMMRLRKQEDDSEANSQSAMDESIVYVAKNGEGEL